MKKDKPDPASLPAIAVFAATPAQSAYLRALVVKAGMRVAEDGGSCPQTAALCAGGALSPQGWSGPLIQIGGARKEGARYFEAPVRASAVIEALGKIARDLAAPPDHFRLAGGSVERSAMLWYPDVGHPDAGGEPLRLTEKEVAILLYLYQAGGAVSKAEILARVWGYADTAETHTLETHIYRLRQKIERDPSNPAIVLTDGDGYRAALKT
jgi:hypothetical protein